MKKIFVVLAILIIVLMAAAAFFMATFDANRYKAELSDWLSRKMGYPVEIGSIAFGFENGLALRAGRVSVSGDFKNQSAHFLLEAKQLFLRLDLESLLRKEVLVKEVIVVSPFVRYEQYPAGGKDQNLSYLPTVSERTSSSGPARNTASLQAGSPPKDVRFEIENIKIAEGTFLYEKDGSQASRELALNHVACEAHNVSLTSPITFTMEGEAEWGFRKSFELEGTFSYAQDTLRASGSIDRAMKIAVQASNLRTRPSIRLDGGFDGVDLASFYTEEEKQDEHFAGVLSGNVSLQIEGGSAAGVTGVGKLEVANGAWKNRNVIRETLEKITQIPGANLLVKADLGPRFEALMKSRDTSFDLMKVDFQVEGQTVQFNAFDLSHADYVIALKGMYETNGRADMRGILSIRPVLAQAMIKKAKELIWIADRQNQIVIPFFYRGMYPKAALLPDLGDLVGRTVQNVGTEFVNQALESLLKKAAEKAESKTT